MATMGKYCKAYPIQQLSQFKHWSENSKNTRKEKQEINGKEVEVNCQLAEDDILYLQENYVVTDGIFKDENIIFVEITPEWKNFCTKILLFEIPNHESVEVKALTNFKKNKN